MSEYVLGFDIGISSVGWSVIREKDLQVIESGVRLFDEADAGENKKRRSFRGIKRNVRRKQNRLKTMEMFLNSNNFDKPDFIDKTPLDLRVLGLSEKLTREEIFVVIYNLTKHRGISYLEDIEDVKDSDKLLEEMKKIENKYPCIIQKERLENFGFYRGTHIIDETTYMNIFKISMYEKELRQILKIQSSFYKEIDEQFIENVVKIIKTKREYYIGPGNNKNRTNYGVYKTSGKTEDNLFNELRGKCSIFSGKYGMDSELRASSASYTVQYYNLLNDLCNIKYNGDKLTEKEKIEVIEFIKGSKTSVKISQVLKKLYKYNPDYVTGYRIDKNDKEENHSFEIYRKIKKSFSESGLDVNLLSEKTLNICADILTLNTEKDGIIKHFNNKKNKEYEFIKDIPSEYIEKLIEIRLKNTSLFKNWSNFSYKLLDILIPEMLKTGDEQHTCLNRLSLKKYNTEKSSKINADLIVDEIYNPVVTRSIRQTIKILNQLLKNYEFSNIVIEMPRDKNSQEQKDNIKKLQKYNEEIKTKALKYADTTEGELNFRRDKNILNKLILNYKQKGRCLYSGNAIDIKGMLSGEKYYEIDDIIPISISFDDSQSNKVLVELVQNQSKGQKTPYNYLNSSSKSNWNYNTYKAYVLQLYKEKLINKKHKDNLLFEEDITKQQVVQGFINRNINDTRYASKVILNEFQVYFKNNNNDTKIKVINGAMTNQFRKQLKLDKDRNLDFRHHAQDAMICAYSLLSLKKYQDDNYVNNNTNEMIDKESFNKLKYNDKNVYLTLSNWDTKNTILQASKKIKFSHKIDTKVNRCISDATIYGTRKIDDDLYTVNKIKTIYENNEKKYNNILKKIKTKEEKFLMYKHDKKTWDILLNIINMYKGEKCNPFIKYKEEFGPVKKYSKKGNGPEIISLKYLEHKVGKNIDITHNYKNCKNKVVLESLKPFRADLFYDNNKKVFHLIPIKYADFKFEKGKYILSNEKYNKNLIDEKVIKQGETLEQAINNGLEFKYSFYKNNIIELINKDGKTEIFRFLSKSHSNKNYFEVKYIDKKEDERIYRGITRKIQTVNKYNVDILGNLHKVEEERLKLEFKLDNKMIL